MPYAQERVLPYGGERSKAEQVEAMFDGIAHSYDALNRGLSLGLDRSWRRRAIAHLAPFAPRTVLDVATGTGDFALGLARELRPERVVGVDISEGMMALGREKARRAGLSGVVSFERGDCARLGFGDGTFDAVTMAFGMRNFQDLDAALAEMHRVLKRDGHACFLELGRPVGFPMGQAFRLYSRTLLPLCGRVVSGDRRAYGYLVDSIEAFPGAEAMAGILAKAGFRDVGFRRLTLGLCTLYHMCK